MAENLVLIYLDQMSLPDSSLLDAVAAPIEAAPERIWAWLAQLGSTRAGWYSYDVDNDDAIANASARALSPVNCRTPVTSSKSTTPSDQTSLRASTLAEDCSCRFRIPPPVPSRTLEKNPTQLDREPFAAADGSNEHHVSTSTVSGMRETDVRRLRPPR